jgi:hypothetical protein
MDCRARGIYTFPLSVAWFEIIKRTVHLCCQVKLRIVGMISLYIAGAYAEGAPIFSIKEGKFVPALN